MKNVLAGICAVFSAVQLFPPQTDLKPPAVVIPVVRHKLAEQILKIPRTKAGPLRGVGQIRRPLNSRYPSGRAHMGTGYPVEDSCHITSNYHVVFDKGQKPSSKQTVNFYYGQGDDLSYAPHIPAHPMAWGNYNYAMPSCDDDWVLLRLEKCPSPDVLPPIFLSNASRNRLKGANAAAAGILLSQQFRDGNLQIDENCTFLGGAEDGLSTPRGGLVHDCSSDGGSSGSPIVTMDPATQKVSVLGMMCADQSGVPQGTFVPAGDGMNQNYATPVSSFYKPVIKALAQAK